MLLRCELVYYNPLWYEEQAQFFNVFQSNGGKRETKHVCFKTLHIPNHLIAGITKYIIYTEYLVL